jgi:hypothetical protein
VIFVFPFIGLFLATIYFAFIGVKVTVEKHHDAQSMDFVRDILKYAALFLSVFFLSFGLAGLLANLIDPNNVAGLTDEDTARALSFVIVGIPVVAVISKWIKRDFTKNLENSFAPAWQIYLFAATTFTFLIWFLFLSGSLNWLAGEPYNPKGLAQGVISFLLWLVHLRLIAHHRSLTVNLHRFIGWFTGITGSVVAVISLLEYAISKSTGFSMSRFQIQEAIILLAVAVPTALHYWEDFNLNVTAIEQRVYRIFGGLIIPALFATIAATFTSNQLITWFFGEHMDDAKIVLNDVPSTLATSFVLALVMIYFSKLLKVNSNFEWDLISRGQHYLLSAMAMVGVAISLGTLIAGALDKGDHQDATIFGISLLFTTLPTWIVNWRKCQVALALEFEEEHTSPIRRFYLYAMIGVPTIVALGASVFVLFTLFKGLLIGGFDSMQLSTPLGILVSTGAVALYHFRIYRLENS